MAPRTDNTPLVVILGATGSGKSSLGLELCTLFNGAVIAADSRTVYKEMSIGTAKPTIAEQTAIQHYLIDIVSPDQSFTAADFKLQAREAINDIASQHKNPFLVGGTGLYIDALLYDFTLRPTVVNEGLRKRLPEMSVAELQEYILRKGFSFPRDSQNPRRLIRTIESGGALPQKKNLRQDTLILGLDVSKEELSQRITSRVERMVDEGLVEELNKLAKHYGWTAPALQTPGFKAFHSYIEGGSSLDEAKATFVRNDMNLAKRQRTWFNRNKDVHWMNNKERTVELVTTFLNKY